MKQIIAITFAFWIGWFFGYSTSDSQIEKYEAGKRFTRDSLLNLNDSLVHYSGIPDSVLNKNVPELNNGGSYRIHGKGLK